MTPPNTLPEFLEVLRQSGLVAEDRVASYLKSRRASWKNLSQPADAAQQLVADGLLSSFQAKQILRGKYRGFWVNKYLILESLASGGMGRVMLCEQTPMSRLVAVKILPTKDQGALERFHREARAVAALDHANIVRAFDIDHETRFHFLVMEYVDGTNLQDLVDEHGRLEVGRACHYVAQAALGLQHAHEAGWVHRDIKPGNLLVDRNGVVKILDLGLARLTTDDKDNLTRRFDEHTIIGTAEYLAPEQSLPDQIVDSRADIYSLGITLYFLLTGKVPFDQGSVLQKIVAHQMKMPKPISELRAGLPKELIALIDRMMDKSPAQRPQTAREIAEILMALAKEEAYPLLGGEYTEHCPRVRQLLQAKGGPRTTPLPIPIKRPPARDKDTDEAGYPSVGKRPAPRRTRQLLLIGAGAAAALILLGAGLWWWLGNRSPVGPVVTPRQDSSKKDKPPIAKTPETVPGVLTADDALKHVNKICSVQMLVRSTGMSKNQKMVFLNSQVNYRASGNLSIVLSSVDHETEPKGGLEAYFKDKTIRVKGQVTLYNEQRQIVVNDWHTIEIITGSEKK